MPSRRCTSRSSAPSRIRSGAPSPEAGSSRRSSRGRRERAQTSSTSFAVPMESSSTRSWSVSVSPSRWTSSSARSGAPSRWWLKVCRTSARRRPPSRATCRLSATVACLSRPMFWKVRARPARARCAGDHVSMRRPARRTRPEWVAANPLMTLKKVVLPAPLGPMRPTKAPSRTVSVTRSRAFTAPKETLTSITSRTRPRPGGSRCGRCPRRAAVAVEEITARPGWRRRRRRRVPGSAAPRGPAPIPWCPRGRARGRRPGSAVPPYRPAQPGGRR